VIHRFSSIEERRSFWGAPNGRRSLTFSTENSFYSLRAVSKLFFSGAAPNWLPIFPARACRTAVLFAGFPAERQINMLTVSLAIVPIERHHFLSPDDLRISTVCRIPRTTMALLGTASDLRWLRVSKTVTMKEMSSRLNNFRKHGFFLIVLSLRSHFPCILYNSACFFG
jgi:hypothetical protein